MDAVLKVDKVSMDFGGLRAVDRFELEIREKEIVALIGPNGAGKTTLFNCLTGVYVPSEGNIFIHPPGGKEERINGVKTHKITEKGLARTFQNIRLFSNMT